MLPPFLFCCCFILCIFSELELNLITKYGEGKTLEKECKNCGYINELRSGGVHFGEGGSVSVFCDDEIIHCLACGHAVESKFEKLHNTLGVRVSPELPTVVKGYCCFEY